MRKQLISFAKVIKILWNIKLKGGGNPKHTPPLRTPLVYALLALELWNAYYFRMK